ncbi:Uncharacterized membrane protein YfhO [Eubacterium ruminantium]|nr:Uncharacterized membrane protein YfhO [Eubacterium ruminantium]
MNKDQNRYVDKNILNEKLAEEQSEKLQASNEEMKNKAEEKKLKRSRDKNRLSLVLAFLIPFIIAMAALSVGGFAPFGKKDVLTAGGFEKYRYLLNDLNDRFHDNAVSNSGLISAQGYDTNAAWAYYLSDPTNLIAAFFNKSSMASVIDILYAVKLGLAGFFFSLFLRHRRKKEDEFKEANEKLRSGIISAYAEKVKTKKELKLIKKYGAEKAADRKFDIKFGGTDDPSSKFGKFLKKFDILTLALSVTYALSAYMLESGLNVTLLGAVAVFPLIMLGIDKLIYEEKWLPYCIAMTVSFYLSLYLTLIIFIFTFFYFLLQEYKCTKHILVSFLYKILADILALGAASIVLISSINSLLMKNMLSLEFPLSQAKVKIFDIFKCQLAGIGSDPGTGNTYGTAIYAGIFIMILCFLYATNGNISLNRRIRTLILTAVLYTATFQSTLNYLFNGFYYTENNSTFFGFILIFMMLNIAYSVLINIDHQRGITELVSFIIVLGMIFAALLKSTNYKGTAPFLTSIWLAAVYFTIFIVYRKNSMTKIAFKLCLGLMMIAEISVSFISGFKNIGAKAFNYSMTDTAHFEAAEDYIHSQDKNAKIYVFIEGQSTSNPVTNMLSGYDYIIAKKTAKMIPSMLEFIGEYDNINIYYNKYAIHNGFYVNEKMKDMVFDDEETFKSLNVLCDEVLETEKPYNLITGDFFFANVVRYDLKGRKYPGKQYQAYFTPAESGDIYATILGNVLHVGEGVSGEELEFPYNLHYKPAILKKSTFQFATLEESTVKTIYKDIKKNGTEYNSSDSLSINLSAEKPGYVMLPVSDMFWSSYDADTKYITFLDTTYMVVPVNAGDNSIRIYHSSITTVAVVISVLFIAIMAVIAVFGRKKKASLYEDKSVIKITCFLSANRVYILSIAFSTLIFLIMLFARSTAPFGNGYFLAHDGMAQSYPFITGIIKSIFKGDLTLMNYHVGAGIDNYITSFPIVITPFYYIIGLFSLETVKIGFTLLSYIMFILPGVSMLFYLTRRPNAKNLDKNDMRLLPLSFAYGLSAFAISYISHLGFVLLLIIFPILMYALENLVYNKKWGLYVALMTYLMIWGVYYAFLISEFIVLYFLCMNFDSVKDFFKKGIRVAVYSVLCAGLSAVMLIPYYISTTLSPYVEHDSELPSIMFDSHFLKIFDFIKPGADAVTITLDDWKVNVYCGLLLFLLIPVYALNKKIKFKDKIRKLILAGFLFISFGNPLLNYILHGLHLQVKVPNRFSYYLIFLLITMAYDLIVYSEEKLSKKTKIITTVWTAALAIIWLINNGFKDLSTIIGIIFAAAYIAVMFYYNRAASKKFIYKVLSLLLAAEITFSVMNYTRFNTYGNHATNEADSYGNAIDIVDRNNLDKDMVRTCYFSRLRNTSLFINTDDVSVFASNMTKNNIDFINHMGMSVPSITNYVEYLLTNPLVDLFLNVQYHLVNEYYENNMTYDYMKEVDKSLNLTLYKNPYVSGFGFFIANDNPILALEENGDIIHDGNVIESHNKIARALTGQDLYTEIELEDDLDKIDDSSTYLMTDIHDLDDETIEDPKAHVRVVLGKDVKGNVYLNFGYYAYLTLKETDEPYEILFDMDEEQYNYYSGNTFRIAVLNIDTLKKIVEIFSESKLENISKDFNTISGTIFAPSDGITYISLPYQEGWTAEVDGKKVELVECLEGIGIPVTAGTHSIKLTYLTPGLKTGALISLIFLVILGVYISISVIRKKRTGASDASVEASSEAAGK